jgi:hypothetical protein
MVHNSRVREICLTNKVLYCTDLSDGNRFSYDTVQPDRVHVSSTARRHLLAPRFLYPCIQRRRHYASGRLAAFVLHAAEAWHGSADPPHASHAVGMLTIDNAYAICRDDDDECWMPAGQLDRMLEDMLEHITRDS